MESLLQLSARVDAHERHEEQYGADSTAAKNPTRTMFTWDFAKNLFFLENQ